MPDELREEVAIELEAIAQVVDELLALQRDVAKREPTLREKTAAVAARPYVSAESRSTVTLDATLDRNRERFPDPIHFYLGQGKHRLALARV